MKLTFTLLIAVFSVTVCFAQRIVDSAFYENGALQSYGHYDSTKQYWHFYRFYKDGKTISHQKLDPVYFQNCDSFIAYNPNGRIAWILPHKDRFVTGKFEEFYLSGQLKRSGYYYRGFKTGAWLEYYPDDHLKAESYFSLTKADSSFNRTLTKADYDAAFAVSDTLTWGETDTVLALKPDAVYFPIHYTFTYLSPQKTGVWKQYSQTGKVTQRTRYDKVNK